MIRGPTVCWPGGKTPKVVTMHEVPDLRELTAGMGMALGLEDLVGQRKTNSCPPTPIPSCCVPECKCCLSLALKPWLKENVKDHAAWFENICLTNS